VKISLLLLLVTLSCCASILLAGEPWDEKPFTDWEIEDLYKLSQNSPWAREVFITLRAIREYAGIQPHTVPVYTRDGGVVGYKTVGRHQTRTGYEHDRVVVQWASSLTLRQARVRQGELKGAMSAEREAELLASPSEHYAIAVRGAYLHAFLQRTDEAARDSALQSVYLRPRSGKTRIFAADMKVFPSGEPEDLLLGEPVVWFLFPRQLEGKPAISAWESKVDFHWNLGDVDIQDVHATFDLSKMVRDAKPDL